VGYSYAYTGGSRIYNQDQFDGASRRSILRHKQINRTYSSNITERFLWVIE